MDAQTKERFPAVTHVLTDGANVVLRPLQCGDAAALGDFYESIPRKDARFYLPHPLTRDKAAENAAAADDPCQVVVVIQLPDDSIGGYAWYRWREGADSSGFGICVRLDLQGTGAGRAVIARVLEIARHVGPPVMHLTVQKANTRALALYRSVGFEVVREQERQPNAELGFAAEPEYFMQLCVRETEGDTV